MRSPAGQFGCFKYELRFSSGPLSNGPLTVTVSDKALRTTVDRLNPSLPNAHRLQLRLTSSGGSLSTRVPEASTRSATTPS